MWKDYDHFAAEAVPSPSVVAAADKAAVVRATLSRENAMKRLGRFFRQRADGSYAASEALVKMWNDKEGKEELLQEYYKSGANKDFIYI